MQLIQFLAAWLFPGAAQCFAVDMATADSSELDGASSSPSSFSANAAGSGSSSPSSSSSDSHSSRSRRESPSTTPLCFGAGGGGGRRLLRGSRERAPPAKQPQAATMAPKVKGDVVGRYLRKISKRLRKARSDGKGSPPSPMAAAAVDDTARERAEAVARAISYCKETLRRGTSPSPSPPPPPPPPSPSLDDWLQDRQEEIIASAAAVHCDDECSDPRPSPPHPRRGRDDAGWPLGMRTMEKGFPESPCPEASPSRDGSLAATAVAHGEPASPRHGHGIGLSASPPGTVTSADANAMQNLMRRQRLSSNALVLHALVHGESSMSSLDEMEFLKTFDGDEEMINHHFITVEIY